MTDTENGKQTEIFMVEPALHPARPRDTTSIIFVSLYLLLLAFFIFLHSISVFREERVRSVLGSVEIAFQGLSRDTPAERQKKLTGEEQGTQAFHAKLKNVFETAMPLVESRKAEGGTRLQFTASLKDLFSGGSLTPRGSLDTFLEEVAAALIDRNRNLSTDMEIMIGTGVTLPDSGDRAPSLAAQRLNALVRLFLQKGVAARNLSIGMEAGDAGLVHFSFFPRKDLGFQFRPDGGRP